MKQITKHNRTLGALALKAALAAAALALVLTVPLAHAGQNPNPGIAPPNSNPYGHSYGEWGGLWWRWALGIPAEQNPVVDSTGEFAGEGESGPVWFLAGNFGGTTERTVRPPDLVEFQMSRFRKSA